MEERQDQVGAVGGPEAPRLGVALGRGEDRALGEDDALRPRGRPRGVEDQRVSLLVELGGLPARVTAQVGEVAAGDAVQNPHPARRRCFDRVALLVVEDQAARLTVLEREAQLVGRVLADRRHEHAAGPQRRQHRQHELGTVREAQRDPVTGPDADRRQSRCQLVDGLVELGVGPGAGAVSADVDDCLLPRLPGRLEAEGAGEGDVGDARRASLPPQAVRSEPGISS